MKVLQSDLNVHMVDFKCLILYFKRLIGVQYFKCLINPDT